VGAVLHGPPRRQLAAMFVALTAATSASAMLATPASAGFASKRDRSGDVRARGLTPAERRALDIVSVTVVGDEDFGSIVTVRFRGNIERALGRGHLRRGLVAVASEPRSRRASPAILATRGRGAFGQTLRKTRSTRVLVLRDGRELTFIIIGPGISNVGRITVLAFAEAPGRPDRRRASRSQTAGNIFLGILGILREGEAEQERLAADRSARSLRVLGAPPDSCDELRRELGVTTEELARLDEDLDRAREDRRRSAIRDLERYRPFLVEYLMRIRQRLEAMNCGGAGTTPPDGAFSVSVMGSHRHSGGDTSDLCVDVKTSPPRPGASAQVRVRGADGSMAERTITLDSNGEGRVRGTIGVKQRYDIDVTVTATDGATASASTSHTVGDAQGSCPPP
jgi:hypothetical protein